MVGGRIVCSLVLFLAACGDDADPAQTFDLSDGTRVTVTSDGAAALTLDGRPLWAMSSDAPTVHVFEETFVGALAIYEFTRTDRVEIPLSDFRGAETTGDSVVLTYASANGSHTGTLTIAPDDADVTRVTLAVSGMARSIAMPTRCDADGTFFGFGEQYNRTEQTGDKFDLIVSEQGIGRTGSPRALSGDEHTTYFPMPYYLDARGFGVLIETDRRTIVDLCRDSDTAWLEVVDDRPIDMVVFHGPTPKDVVRQLGDRVGRPALPPDWAWTLWISAQGGRDAVVAEVDALAAANIPIGVVWTQDWTGERINADGGKGVEYRWEADLERYPDLAGMVADFHGRGLKFLAYVNPFIDPDLPNHYDEMDAAGLLIKTGGGSSYEHTAPNGSGSHPDLTNPDTRAYVEAALTAIVQDYGIDGWMADFGEWIPLDAVISDGTDARDYHNRFPLEWHRTWRTVMDAERPDGDYVVFGRSGWTGVHAFSQIHWVGDQETSFSETDGLPTVPVAMINLGLSGIPYVTHDIAGFSSLEGPSTKELWLRWVELGAFTPIMRTHEGAFRDDNWAWDKDAESTAHFKRFANVHAALADELQSLAMDAQTTSVPIVRHLMLEFPDDPATYTVHDQYMLGPDLLVAPVLTEGATARDVYLPAGTWFDVWTGEEHQGGQVVTVAAPIGSPPVFSRGADRADLRAIE